MTLVEQASAVCPACRAKIELEILASVNVSISPDLKRRVLDGSLFDHTCPRCGLSGRVSYPLLYHDMDAKLQVDLRPDGEPPAAALIEIADVMFEAPFGDGYRLRWVERPVELAEKIRIFDAGLDDRVIEVLKVWTLAGSEDFQRSLVFVGANRERLEFMSEDGDPVRVESSRYDALRSQFVTKFCAERGWARVDRAFALDFLRIPVSRSARPSPRCDTHARLVEAEASGLAVVGVDRVYARWLFTSVPGPDLERVTGEASDIERFVVCAFWLGSILALVSAIVVAAVAFGWISVWISLGLVACWFSNRQLAERGASSAWLTTLLLVLAVGLHLSAVGPSPSLTWVVLLAATSLWCEHMLYASSTVFLRALVLRNPRALAAFADGIVVR